MSTLRKQIRNCFLEVFKCSDKKFDRDITTYTPLYSTEIYYHNTIVQPFGEITITITIFVEITIKKIKYATTSRSILVFYIDIYNFYLVLCLLYIVLCVFSAVLYFVLCFFVIFTRIVLCRVSCVLSCVLSFFLLYFLSCVLSCVL